nr:retrovirus-related Pol polyprotein from transposon TNT 1-94 [Tanacetum cinerariifolium]
MWSDQEKKIQKIDHLARSLLIQGLPNDIYSLIDSNKTAKDLWDALARHMLDSEYGEQDRKAAVFLYDKKVIGLGYTLMFLTHSDEALEIEKFKRARENKIEFAYDYGNLNANFVNEKIKFSDDYFQEIINPDFEKIDSSFQQTSSLKPSLKPYVSNVILKKIIIDLDDEVVSLLEKEKENLETIESLKSKGFKSSENAISKIENQSENDCQVVEKECDNVENPKKKKWSSNTSNVDLSSVNHLKLNKDVKRYSRKDLLSCNNSHLRETSSAYVCNDAMNVSCNSRLYDSFDENNLFIFDDESVRIYPVSKMPFMKKPYCPDCLWIIDSGCSKHMTGNHALLTNFVEKFLGTVRFGNNDFAIIMDLEDEVVSLLEKEKENLETIESLKLKGFELRKNVSSESKNQSENDCLVVEKECDKEENPKNLLDVESIHIKFDEINEINASDYDNSGPAPQLENISPSVDAITPSQQELDLLFGPLYNEFFTV